MRIKFLLVALFCVVIGFAQSINDYKAVIVPLKYDFMKSDNQYRMATMTKSNLIKAGFQAFYANEDIPAEFSDRCQLLYIDVKKDNAFLMTKLFIEFKDCYGKVVYTSEVGKSKEKDYETAYRECLEMAFVSVTGLHYKYSGKMVAPTGNKVGTVALNPAAVAVMTPAATAAVATPAAVVVTPVSDVSDPNLLYAQPTENGYQLIDKTPKVVMKLLKTSRPDSFIAIKDGVQGTLNAKDNQWFFEYYQNDKLVSEKVSVKF
ncbi:hypothetical protein SAMN05444397_103127 [Flavobacterium aquidurense]|uniref:DUF4468 domain-containing protein n=1 Tax=Flavobacterium frigidimaris TaxID=262320 RepID=A0ABX4BVJ4_FLAFR|nr:hypothetical protein [Flavobacterium frigidimaris]OXA81371.1 hypothetical protein B0A65_03705 [Flavobacterium frigidimaris]SDZ02708.1 hypothetical protein SAMN05444397_103127 [Flavobacterium aquidurense]